MPLFCPVAGLINMRLLLAITQYIRPRPWTAILVAVFFIPVYAWLYVSTGPIYPSPDERTLAVFAETWAETGTFVIEAPSDMPFLPRSVSLFADAYVPSGFLGLFLLMGLAWRCLGVFGAWLLVPILAAFAPLAMLVVWKRIVSARMAWLATVALWVFPAWAYYAGRGFLPNVAFVSFIAFALAAFVFAETRVGIQRAQVLAVYALGGFSLGLAGIIRPVEMLWVMPVLLVLAWFKRQAWRRYLVACIGFVIPVVILAYWQAQTYGAWYAVGYVVPSLVDGANNTVTTTLWSQILAAWFPFGIHPVQALLRFVQYLIFVYWWAWPWALIGLVALVKSARTNRAHKMYAGIFLAVSTYLIVYYGSWPISDHPDAGWMSIGVAYNRYWLPIFVLGMPFLALGVERFKQRVWIWAFVLFCSVGQTMVFGADSFWGLRAHSVEYSSVAEWVMQQTTPNTIVIANREEKFLWPSRTVWFQPDETYDFADEVSARFSESDFVWLTTLPPSHVQDLQQRVFLPAGVEMQEQSQFHSYYLYVLKPRDNR